VSDQPSMPDFDALLSQAMQMQQQVMAAQAEAAARQVTGVAGGGAVEVDVTGALEFTAVRIAPEAVDPDDVGLLEDLVLAALHDATAKVHALQSESLGGFGDLLAGSGLGGVLGGPVMDVAAGEDLDEDSGEGPGEARPPERG
jgi:DNA-binding YbaB/EbfC family protein